MWKFDKEVFGKYWDPSLSRGLSVTAFVKQEVFWKWSLFHVWKVLEIIPLSVKVWKKIKTEFEQKKTEFIKQKAKKNYIFVFILRKSQKRETEIS